MSALCLFASAQIENRFVGWFRPLALIDRQLKAMEGGWYGVSYCEVDAEFPLIRAKLKCVLAGGVYIVVSSRWCASFMVHKEQ